MKHLYRPLLGGLALWLGMGAASAQTPAPALLHDEAPRSSPLADALLHSRALALDEAQARTVLADAQPEDQPGARALVISLPLPDGRNQRFAVWRTALMAPALATRYPQIQTYVGKGLDDPTATARLDLTPQGFHAQVLSARTGTVYIEPARRDATGHYLSFFRRDARPEALSGAGCDFQPPKAGTSAAGRASRLPAGGTLPQEPAAIAGGAVLRTYRLALAATGEYTTFHGGTKRLALAAMVTSINRVVGVYEKELAVRLQLVPRTDTLIYVNASTDPYTNNSGSAMLGQNQTNVDALIGTSNYDIGHVFSTGGGGVAGYAVVCVPGNKARGVTGSSAPVADAFDIDYVAHEMGHQFSGSHPFNGNTGSCGGGNRSADAAWEPGSGTTIMAYAGICGAQNLQAHSDAFFHVGNYEEMRAFIVTTPCAVTRATGNTPPTVSIPAVKTLPIGTPFRLTASGSDADGDTLTYNWEEIDRGSAGSPTATQVANNNVPLFRSWTPTATATRYFPRLSDVVAGTSVIGERLPTVTRLLTFKVTARDQHRGPAGMIGGVATSDSLKLPVTSAAGPFRVTSPNTAVSWTGGSQQTVTWDVAGTTANGVNCQAVNLRLSTDGGLSYPTVLALGVPNAGTATITVPSVTTTTARLMVEAADNYFFDLSDANFSISSPSPCAPTTGLAVSGITNTGATLNFTPASGAVQYTISTTPATTTQTVTAGPVTLTGLTPGTTYTVQVVSSCGSTGNSVAATATFTTTAPTPCGSASELAITGRTLTSALLSFVPAGATTSYTISTVPASTTQTVAAGPVTLTGLTPATTYVVRVVGNCAGGTTSPAASLAFRTLSPPPANDQCASALPLTCGVRVQGSTEGATATGDPTGSCGITVDQGGVFYTLTGTGGNITVSTCDAATNYDSKLFVYRGSCGSLVCVGGNDDAATCSANSVASAVTFASVAGITYYVMVSGWDTEAGTFGLLATCAPLAARQANATAFEVWPNPAGSGAAFRLTLPAPTTAGQATLHNVLGQRVLTQSFSGSNAELSTAGLAPGTYLLTVEAAGKAPAVRRVVVE